MIRFLSPLAFCAAAAAQLTPTALTLGNAQDPAAVNADLVVFALTVKTADGIWVEPHSSPTFIWEYDMNAQWMSLLADQQPAMQAAKWSMPNVYGVNSWAINYPGLVQQFLPPGDYLLAMADDATEPGRQPSPVIPRATATTFSNADVEIVAHGYAINTSVNAVLELPPWPNHPLQPCDMVGSFPYSVLPGTPPVTIGWIAGGLPSTCTGHQGNFGSQSTGFFGSCSRWVLENWSSSPSVTAPIHLRAFRQDLVLGSGTPLPAAALGVCAVEMQTPGILAPPIDVDLGLAFPGLFGNGGYLRIAPAALLTMTYVNDSNLDLVMPAPNSALLLGARRRVQVGVLQVDGQMSMSDLYSVRFH